MIVDVYASYNEDLTQTLAEINEKLFETTRLTPHIMQRKQTLMERHYIVFAHKVGANNFNYILLAKKTKIHASSRYLKFLSTSGRRST